MATLNELTAWQNALRFLDRVVATPPEHLKIDDLVRAFSGLDLKDEDCKRLLLAYKEKKCSVHEVYVQLVSILLKKDSEKCEAGYREARQVHRLEEGQYLTMRMQTHMNDFFFKELIAVKGKLENNVKEAKNKDKKIEELERENASLKSDFGKLEADLKAVVKDVKRLKDKSKKLKSHSVQEDDLLETLVDVVGKLDDKMKGLGQLSENSLVSLRDLIMEEVGRSGSFNLHGDKDIAKLKKEFEAFKSTSWTVLARLYGVFRCYTMLVHGSPSGKAANKVPMAMGVYRLIGVFNDHPLYKKDGGEMYLYFMDNAWMVGPSIGFDRTWLKRPMNNDGHEPVWSLLPDLSSGWDFQTSKARHTEAKWSGDVTVKCEPLRDVDAIIHALCKATNTNSKEFKLLTIAAGKTLDTDQVISTPLSNPDVNGEINRSFRRKSPLDRQDSKRRSKGGESVKSAPKSPKVRRPSPTRKSSPSPIRKHKTDVYHRIPSPTRQRTPKSTRRSIERQRERLESPPRSMGYTYRRISPDMSDQVVNTMLENVSG